MKNFKIWLALLLIFFAGFASGMLTSRTITRHLIRAALAHPNLVRAHIEHGLDRELRLDPAQRVQVHQALARAEEQLKGIHQEFQPRVHSILQETRRAINAVLRPEQQREFEQFLAEHAIPALAARSVHENK